MLLDLAPQIVGVETVRHCHAGQRYAGLQAGFEPAPRTPTRASSVSAVPPPTLPLCPWVHLKSVGTSRPITRSDTSWQSVTAGNVPPQTRTSRQFPRKVRRRLFLDDAFFCNTFEFGTQSFYFVALLIRFASRPAKGVLLAYPAQLLALIVQLVAGDTKLHWQARCRGPPEFEQPNGFQLEFLAEPRQLALLIEVADYFPIRHLQRRCLPSNCVREGRSASLLPTCVADFCAFKPTRPRSNPDKYNHRENRGSQT